MGLVDIYISLSLIENIYISYYKNPAELPLEVDQLALITLKKGGIFKGFILLKRYLCWSPTEKFPAGPSGLLL